MGNFNLYWRKTRLRQSQFGLTTVRLNSRTVLTASKAFVIIPQQQTFFCFKIHKSHYLILFLPRLKAPIMLILLSVYYSLNLIS